MDIVQLPPPSLLTRALRWLGDYEKAIDRQPVDRLALRVADLERRLAVSAALKTAASEKIPAFAGEA